MQTDIGVALQNCRNLASTVVIIGLGDGSLLSAINADPMIRAKDIYALALPGEDVPTIDNPHIHIGKVQNWEQTQQWLFDCFGAHADIIRLAGADFLETHALAPIAAQFREEIMPRLRASLADRPWSLGNDINDTFMGLYHASLNAKSLLCAPSLGDVAGSFGLIPAISIGAGPSVKDHLEELRSLQDRCILVACDAVYPALVKEGIIPHVVTPLERLKQQSLLVQAAKGTRTIFAGIPACHPDTVATFEGRTLYVHAMDKLYDWLAPREGLRCLTGSSTGVLSFLVAASLTRGPVYLVGHDLAKGANGSHFEGCEFAAQAFTKETAANGMFGTNGYETRLVPGNSGEPVESIMWWDTFRLEISTQAKLIADRVFNVNAHTKTYAVIENTQAAPLPDPASLPVLPDFRFERRNTDRYDDWRARAKMLPADCESFIQNMRVFRNDLRRMWSSHPNTWKLEELLSRMIPESGVSPGNAEAFGYFLRSAITNEQMYMSHRVRSLATREQAYWHTMQSLDALADALIKAVSTVQPCLEEIANGTD